MMISIFNPFFVVLYFLIESLKYSVHCLNFSLNFTNNFLKTFFNANFKKLKTKCVFLFV